ncbi:HD domain-containing protein [Terriglobus roseus]|uniref:Metal dependent phosphohydrolase n=1 Tax=Terriglobus roseus TaxID=392734 RepID=A0A1H4M126_9BACT|nr:phosphohydrolase [Terriglobus roseus]SEB76656.1 metal dependent phosphohydrolase [Terriglobus roseus]
MSRPNQDWRAALIERIRIEALPPEKFSHQARLYAVARDLADAGTDPVEDDVLFGAAWVHDLGVFTGHRPADPEQLKQWDSTAYTVAHAGAVLLECGFPADKIPAAIECIRTHEGHGSPTTPEGIVLRDADLLEQLGAVAVMRTTAKIAQDTRFITFADAAGSLRRALDSVPGLIHLAAAQAMAEPRILILREFLEALEAESGGLLR